MRNEDENMTALADALDTAANAYRTVAGAEMGNSYGGSIDRIYDCVRNSRNLQNKSRRVRQFNSVY
jgi:hypothetical protein